MRTVRRRPVKKERPIRKTWKEQLEEIEDMEIPKEKKRLVRELQPLHPRRKPRAMVGSVPVVPALEAKSTTGKLIINNVAIRIANETVVTQKERKRIKKRQKCIHKNESGRLLHEERDLSH